MQSTIAAAWRHEKDVFQVFLGQLHTVRHKLGALCVLGTTAGFGVQQVTSNIGKVNHFTGLDMGGSRGFIYGLVVNEFVQAAFGAAITN